MVRRLPKQCVQLGWVEMAKRGKRVVERVVNIVGHGGDGQQRHEALHQAGHTKDGRVIHVHG